MNESSNKSKATEKIASKLWIYPSCGEPSAELVKAAGSEILASILKRRGFDTVDLIQSFFD